MSHQIGFYQLGLSSNISKRQHICQLRNLKTKHVVSVISDSTWMEPLLPERWCAPDGPWPDLLLRTVSYLLLEVCRLLLSVIRLTSLLCSPCFFNSCQFFPFSSFPFAHFSLLLSFFHPPSPPLTLLGSERECWRAGGHLTQPGSWLWLCRAIYKWLLINPRQTLKAESLLLFFLSRTLACIWTCGQ